MRFIFYLLVITSTVIYMAAKPPIHFIIFNTSTLIFCGYLLDRIQAYKKELHVLSRLLHLNETIDELYNDDKQGE